MRIEVDDQGLKQGVLGLVLTLVEVIKDTLKMEACRRMEGERLNEEQIERLGSAIMELEEAVESIKQEQNLCAVVQQIRDGLDDVINQLLDNFLADG